MGFVERTKKAIKRVKRTKEIYDLIGADHDITTNRYLWRHRLYCQQLLTDAMIALLDQSKSGPTIALWRESSMKNMVVTRYMVGHVHGARASNNRRYRAPPGGESVN